MFFWNSLAFSMTQWTMAIWFLVPLPFLNSACTQFSVHILLKTSSKDFDRYLASMWNVHIIYYINIFISNISISIYLLLSRFSHVWLCAPHRWQPTRLPRPWDSPGKNTISLYIQSSRYNGHLNYIRPFPSILVHWFLSVFTLAISCLTMSNFPDLWT